MNADVKGALMQINTSYKAFTHNGKRMSKTQVYEVLKYADQVGYKTTNQIPDKIINEIIDKLTRENENNYNQATLGITNYRTGFR